MQKLPQVVNTVLDALETGGYKACLVGGCVRDLLMGRDPTDFDIATNARPEAIAALFPKTIPTGEKHGTVTVVIDHAHIEVTTFRKDGDYLDHRCPAQVRYVDEIEEDLARRDFTMNAVAMDNGGTLTDPFDGRADIAQKTIRSVGDPYLRFEEDALRMFRAFRFSAQLGFQIEKETLTAIKAQSHLAKTLSAERVRDEIEKMLCSPHPEILADVLDYGLLDAYVSTRRGGYHPPALSAMQVMRTRAAECCPYRRGGNTQAGAESRPYNATDHWCIFAAILQHSGAITDPKAFLKSLRLPRAVAEQAGEAASLSQSPLPEDVVALKHLLAVHGLETIYRAAEASCCLGHPARVEDIQAIIQSGACYCINDLALQGKDLLAYGIPQGAELGETLQTLLAHVIEHPEANEREILLELLASL